jgi:hypothetical protein
MFKNGMNVTIVNRVVTGVDDFGNDVYGSTSTVVGPCSVQPASSRESLSFADQLTSGIVVFAPYGTDVGYIDAVIVDGVQYEVTGQPDVWSSPFTGGTAPVRIDATLVKGASP